ncbi:hypothetical protein GGR58DRAFT_505549 [Xylaria digitata]|nr:hypothetical protein GGR58DRAFT_505549 [Xylaria digitata]
MRRDEQTAHVASCRATLEQQKRSGSDPVVFDTEFSPASLQLWEFAIVEKVSGNCLIDTCSKHENGLNHDSLTRVFHTASENKASAVYNSPRRTTALLVDEIADKFVAASITMDTIFMSHGDPHAASKAFPLRLELQFQIFFRRRDLIGLNRRALEDALQTRLLPLAFDELCGPTEERNENWRPENLAPVAQTSIMDFYQHEEDFPLDPHLS